MRGTKGLSIVSALTKVVLKTSVKATFWLMAHPNNSGLSECSAIEIWKLQAGEGQVRSLTLVLTSFISSAQPKSVAFMGALQGPQALGGRAGEGKVKALSNLQCFFYHFPQLYGF